MRTHEIIVPLLDWDTIQDIQYNNIYKFSAWMKHGFSLILTLHELDPGQVKWELIKSEESLLYRITPHNEIIDITPIFQKNLPYKTEDIPDKIYMSHYGLEAIWGTKGQYNPHWASESLSAFFQDTCRKLIHPFLTL